MHHQHRPSATVLRSASVTTMASSMMRSVSGDRAGHFHVEPEQMRGVERHVDFLN